MIGIAVISDRMIRFSSLKHFEKQFAHGPVKKEVLVTHLVNKYVTCTLNAQYAVVMPPVGRSWKILLK